VADPLSLTEIRERAERATPGKRKLVVRCGDDGLREAWVTFRGEPGTPAHLTADPLKATRLDSKAQCLDVCHGVYARVQEWKLVPREHMFFDDTAPHA
jgi:hypothetical protein